jgi:hypothetical protein
VPCSLEQGDAEEEVEIFARKAGPKHFPQALDALERELTLEPDEQPPEQEVQLPRLLPLQVREELRLDHAQQLLKVVQLAFHSLLVQIKVCVLKVCSTSSCISELLNLTAVSYTDSQFVSLNSHFLH